MAASRGVSPLGCDCCACEDPPLASGLPVEKMLPALLPPRLVPTCGDCAPIAPSNRNWRLLCRVETQSIGAEVARSPGLLSLRVLPLEAVLARPLAGVDAGRLDDWRGP